MECSSIRGGFAVDGTARPSFTWIGVWAVPVERTQVAREGSTRRTRRAAVNGRPRVLGAAARRRGSGALGLSALLPNSEGTASRLVVWPSTSASWRRSQAMVRGRSRGGAPDPAAPAATVVRCDQGQGAAAMEGGNDWLRDLMNGWGSL